MCDVATEPPVLSDSNFKRRPDFAMYLTSEANGGMSAMEQIERQRRVRHMKFPSLKGRTDYDSFVKSHTDLGFKTWNDDGDFHAPAPYRDYDNIIDPVSGFVSAGGEVDRETGRSKLKSLVQIPTTPLATKPQKVNSIRAHHSTAPSDIRRMTTLEPGQPSLWNSRKISDAWVRSQRGGWTSIRDPRLENSNKVSLPNTECNGGGDYRENKEQRDRLALRFHFSTSTQSGFEEVDWDELLHAKKWLPTTTLEERPDTVSLRPQRYADAVDEWQTMAPYLDWYQLRNGFYGNRPVTFCSLPPRTRHIPGYSGCVGGTNLGDIDNAGENFTPLTIKRVNLPRYTDTAHRPDIPKYDGCTLYRGKYAPMHTSSLEDTPKAVTAHTYREFTVQPNISDHKKEAKMSKTVRTVQPGNPFTREHETVAEERPAT